MGGGQCAECQKKKLGVGGRPLQPKLAISEPGDAHEREADRVADQVMRMSPADVSKRQKSGMMQPMVQRRAAGGATGLAEAPPSVSEVLNSPGQPLDPVTRAYFEPRFGHKFGQVNIYAGGIAERSARDVNARAYTVGRNIVFGAGKFAPQTRVGQELMAHELAHVVQQNPPAGGPATPSSSIILQSPDETRTITKVEIIKKAKIGRVTLSDGLKFNLPLDMALTWIESGDYKGKHTKGERVDRIPESNYMWRFKSDKNSPVRWDAIADSEYDIHVSTTIEVADAKAVEQPPGSTKQGGGGKGAGGSKKGEGSGEKTGEEKKEGTDKKSTDGATGGTQVTDEDRKALKQLHERLKESGVVTEGTFDEKMAAKLKEMTPSEIDDFVRYLKESQAKGDMGKVDLDKMINFYKKLSPSDRELLRVNLELQGPGAEAPAELPKEVTLNLTKSAQETAGAGTGAEKVNEQLKQLDDELTDKNLKELAKIHSKITNPDDFSRENLDPVDLAKIPIFNEMMMFEGLLAGATTQSTEIEVIAKDITHSISKVRSYVLEEIAWMAAELAAGSIISALLAPVSGGASLVAGGARAALLLHRLNQLRKFIKKVEAVYTTYTKIREIISAVSKITAAYDQYKVFKSRYDALMLKLETLQRQLKTSDDDTLIEELETLEDTLVDELQAQIEEKGSLSQLLNYFYIPEDASEEDLRRILYNMPRGFEALKELSSFYEPGKTGDLEYSKTLAFKSLRVGILLYPFVGFMGAEVSNRLSALMADKSIGERLIGFTPRGGGKRKAPARKESHAKLKEVKKKRSKAADQSIAKTQDAPTKTPAKKDDPTAPKKKPDQDPSAAKKPGDEDTTKQKPDEQLKKKSDDKDPPKKKQDETDDAAKKDADVRKNKDEEQEDPKKKADAEEKRKVDDEWAQVVTKVKALPGQHPDGLTQGELLVEARKISTKHKRVSGGPKIDEVNGEGYWKVTIDRKKSVGINVDTKVFMSVRTRFNRGRRAVERAVEARGANESDKASIEALLLRHDLIKKWQFTTLRVDNRVDELQGLAVFGKMGNLKEIDIVNVDDVSRLHYGTDTDPIPINFYKEPGNYPKRLNIRGGSIDRDSATPSNPFKIEVKDAKTKTLKFEVAVGLDQSNFIKKGDKLLRKSTTRSETKQKEFREALLSIGFDLTGFDADHVKDLAFQGKDDFDNLWPLNYGVNRHAFLGKWYSGHRVEYRDTSDTKRSKTGTLYELRGKYFKVVGFKKDPPKGYGGKE